jgi:ABC-type oligopeptide transport system substrate-binding subunit
LEEKMKKFFLLLSGLIFLAASLAACAPSRLEMDYGTSFKLQKFNQIADLEAGKKVQPAEGIDGKAAQGAMEKYQKGFEKEAPAPAYTISIGGIGTSSGGK